MTTKKKKKLGRGLAALLGDDAENFTGSLNADEERIIFIPIESLKAGMTQPRRHFDAESLEELARSIKEHGILQPLLVRRTSPISENYEIIAGERRFRAAPKAGLRQVPALVVSLDDATALQVGLVENLQRKDLNPLEEAEGYARLANEFNRTQEDIARIVGKSRPHVANMMRLLTLPPTIQAMLKEGRLTMGHGRLLVGHKDAVLLAHRMTTDNLSVRAAEQLLQQKRSPMTQTKEAAKTDPDILQLQRELTNAIGLKIVIHHQSKGGRLVIHYGDSNQLQAVIDKIKD